MKEYLTETSLVEFVKSEFSEDNFYTFNKKVKEDGLLLNCRPDIVITNKKIIIEFDGNLHYQIPSVILGDYIRDKEYLAFGYNVIRIPYFVQLSNSVIKNLFKDLLENPDKEYTQIYPHGFISDNVHYPSSFCELGLKKFKEDLCRFEYIRDNIMESLNLKGGDKRLYYPLSWI